MGFFDMVFVAVYRLVIMTVLLFMLAPVTVMANFPVWGTTPAGQYVKRTGFDYPSPKWLEQAASQQQEVPNLLKSVAYGVIDGPFMEDTAAVEALLNGDGNLAVKMLEEGVVAPSGIYYVAAVTLEQAGRYEEARRWILEGIKQHPDSNKRGEWVYARILDAKIKLGTDRDWLKNHTVSGLEMNRLAEENYQMVSEQGTLDKNLIRESMLIQLYPRMRAVKPKDPIVAQLLLELAHVESHIGFLEHSLTYLDLAELYGADPSAHAGFRAKLADNLSMTGPILAPFLDIPHATFVFVASVSLLLLTLVFRKELKQLSLAWLRRRWMKEHLLSKQNSAR